MRVNSSERAVRGVKKAFVAMGLARWRAWRCSPDVPTNRPMTSTTIRAFLSLSTKPIDGTTTTIIRERVSTGAITAVISVCETLRIRS